MSHQNITHKEIFMGSQFAEIRRYLSASFAIYKSELSYWVCNFETIFKLCSVARLRLLRTVRLCDVIQSHYKHRYFSEKSEKSWLGMTLNVSFSSNFENSEGLRISESLLQLNQVAQELKKAKNDQN